MVKSFNIFLFAAILLLSSNGCTGSTPVKMADPNASPATVKLFSKMKELTKQGFMIGHQDDMAYGVGWTAPNGKSDVYKVCFDYPAVFGWDLGHIEKGSPVSLDSVPFADKAK